MPNYYKWYVDDTFTIMPNPQAATSFLDVLNSKHPSLNFTMETAMDNTLPFLGMNILQRMALYSAQVYTESQQTLGFTWIMIVMLTIATRPAY